MCWQFEKNEVDVVKVCEVVDGSKFVLVKVDQDFEIVQVEEVVVIKLVEEVEE